MAFCMFEKFLLPIRLRMRYQIITIFQAWTVSADWRRRTIIRLEFHRKRIGVSWFFWWGLSQLLLLLAFTTCSLSYQLPRWARLTNPINCFRIFHSIDEIWEIIDFVAGRLSLSFRLWRTMVVGTCKLRCWAVEVFLSTPTWASASITYQFRALMDTFFIWCTFLKTQDPRFPLAYDSTYGNHKIRSEVSGSPGWSTTWIIRIPSKFSCLPLLRFSSKLMN